MSMKRKVMAAIVAVAVIGGGAAFAVNAEATTTGVTGSYSTPSGTAISSAPTGSTVNLTVVDNQPNTQNPTGNFILTWPAGQYSFVKNTDAPTTCTVVPTTNLPVSLTAPAATVPTGGSTEVFCTGYTNLTGNTSQDIFTLVANGTAGSTSTVTATVRDNTDGSNASTAFPLAMTAATGTQGPAGPTGATGATGASGSSGNGGYYMVASDGGVFCFGGAKFYGSTGNIHLNSPIVGISVTANDGGYRLYAADGGVFDFGDAQFAGSMGAVHLNEPVVNGAAS
jgi:hypothetical protein